MELKKHYDRLYSESRKKLSSGKYEIDHLIDSPEDNRFGITLLLRPAGEVKKKISLFLQQMMKIDPDQYYYPESDMHVTVLPIISCFAGFTLDKIKIPDYIPLIRKAVSGKHRFTVHFSGITASPAGVMIRGFPGDDTLNSLRDSLRSEFRESPLYQSIDERYRLETAHSTVIRYRKKLGNTERYAEALDSYRDFDFGEFEVSVLEFVYNDWYQKKDRTRVLAVFDLPRQR